MRVLRCLVDGPKSCAEVVQALEIGKGGDVSKAMSALEESGFVAQECARNPETGDPLRERRSGSLIISAGPYRRKGTKGKNGRKGCQVDLLIQTRRALCFVEVKRQNEITRDVIAQVDERVRAISRKKGVSAKTALVYDGQLSPVARADGYMEYAASHQDCGADRDGRRRGLRARRSGL